MPYSFFHDHFPEIAKHETRAITVLSESTFQLPPAEYYLYEMYCDERKCDCRRVFFSVVSSLRSNVEAVVAWGWESRNFYEKWIGRSDPQIIRELQGPVLNLTSPQSDLAPAILKLIKDVALQDRIYVERIKNHYKIFRNKFDKKSVRFSSTFKKRRKRKKRK